MRVSSTEIEQQLLAGQSLKWIDPHTGKTRSIQLSLPRQRRILKVLLASPTRSVKALPASFIESLKEAHAAGEDTLPVAEQTPAGGGIFRTWMLKRVEAYGFGGLTPNSVTPFRYEMDGLSTCVEGSNGSGKSSLVAAIAWALTGLRTNDHIGPTTELNNVQPVLNQSGEEIGAWPPVAAYPSKLEELSKGPKVGVRLTFYDVASGKEALCMRRLTSDGKQILSCDPQLTATAGFEAMVQTGTIMPCRLRHLRLGKKADTLLDAVQALTGLDRLSVLGDFVSDLCNGNLDFRRYARRENQQQYKSNFERFLETAQRKLPRDIVNFDRLYSLQSANVLVDLESAKELLITKASEHLRTLSEDMSMPSTAEEQRHLTLAVEHAREELMGGLAAIPVVKCLESLVEQLVSGQLDGFRAQLDRAQVSIDEARLWRDRQLSDSRLRLKTVAARWHKEHHPAHDEIVICPLCGQGLEDIPELSLELSDLRHAGAVAEQTFDQACIVLENEIRENWPKDVTFDADYWTGVQPKATILAGIQAKFVSAERYSGTLVGIARRVTEYLVSAESDAPEFPELSERKSIDNRVETCIEAGKRLIRLAEWWRTSQNKFTAAWQNLTQGAGDQTISESGSLSSCLDRCSDALALAAPFREAAADLESASVSAAKWHQIETEQAARDAIAETIAPLKDLRTYIQHQTFTAINLLSSRIGDILEKIYLIDNLRYENTTFTKQAVTVHGSFNERFKVDATLVANTSWLRAVLWAFIFALRHETLSRLQFNPLPLICLDDPQTTFDPQHRRKWAELISTFQNLPPQDLNHAQFLIATHESAFVHNLKVEGYSGSTGTMSGVRISDGLPAIILDGRRLDQLWQVASESKAPQAARDFIGEVRLEIEIRLRIMLRGEGTDVPKLIFSELRGRLESLHVKRIPPFDRPLMKSLLGLISASLKQVQLINWPHHFQDDDIGYAQAVEVEQFWRKQLGPALIQAFEAQRDYVAVFGERSFSISPRKSITLPDGHAEILRRTDFLVRGCAAAMSGGRVSDGRLAVAEYELSGQTSVKLLNHAVYLLTAPTIEPVATTGDGLIVSHSANVNPKNLVVVTVGDGVYARRFDISEASPELAILSAQAVNPYDIKPPVAITCSSISPKKIVGILYNMAPPSVATDGHEVEEIPNQNSVDDILREAYGLYKVDGRSAEPYVLNGQYLIVKSRSSDGKELPYLDGKMVVALDENGGHYFKRLRMPSPEMIILESLDLTGRESSVVLGTAPGTRAALVAVIPVLGVLFELPA